MKKLVPLAGAAGWILRADAEPTPPSGTLDAYAALFKDEQQNAQNPQS